ncbi:MAG: hypothetical protein Q4A34_02235 [Candidatus Saccharibacteria bacterium]|nr:hypothetical protein [Candidatus Saccharibacteria bacterium]
MFRKIVSHLPFSPTLIHELGFYAKRLSKEEATRRMGLIVTALALVVQSFVLFNPPESANASHPSDMVNGGVWDGNALLRAYDRNTNNFADLMDTIGITRAELYKATENQQTLSSTSGNYSWGLTPQFGGTRGEGSYMIKSQRTGGTRTFYYRPHHLWGSFTYGAFVGHSAKFGWFAIMKDCGNLIAPRVPAPPTCPPGQVGKYPHCSVPPKKCTIPGKTHLLEKDPNCKPDPKCTIPGKTTLKANDPNCKPDPVASCKGLQVSPDTARKHTYQFAASAEAKHGARINGYTFKVYRDSKLIDTLQSNKENLTYTQSAPGSYKVILSVRTSVAEKTAPECEKTFTVAPPEKCPVNPQLLKEDPRCQPCPGDPTLWLEDKTCKASFVQLKSAQNLTRHIDAAKTTAKAGDRITYRLRVTNKGLAPADYTFKESLSDVLDYATVFDNGGGTLQDDPNSSNGKAKLLVWPTVRLKPGESQERSFTIKVVDKISPMGTGTSHPGSFDCRMDNTFGNTVSINVDCPVEKKVVETVAAQLPRTGAGDNMLFAGILLAVVTYFYMRSRQLKKEIRIIRHNFNAGTL